MDSHGQSAPPTHHQQHHQHHQQQPAPPQGMVQHLHHHHHPPQQQPYTHHPTNSPYQTPQNMPNSSSNHPQMLTALNSPSPILQNSRFPFVSSPVVTSAHPLSQSGPKTQLTAGLEPLNSQFSGDASRQSGFGIDTPNPSSSSHKKKRGRPRKYSPDRAGNTISLGLAPTPMSPPVVGSGGGGGGGGGQADSGGTGPSSDKKHRGRPPGSSKKQLDALGNCGVGFTPHVILVNPGEDIAHKLVAFSKQGPRTVCVLSANGSISNVCLRQSAHTGGVVNYEGRFEIISLSGSFLYSENNNGGQVRTGGLSVSLAGSDGRVLGGGVAGMLTAATPVQIVVGSFIANGKKVKYMPSVPQSSFAAPQPADESPPSQGGSSEGSEENGSNSNQTNNIDRTMGSYGNSTHPVHNLQMYNSMNWPNSATKMLPN